MALIDLKFIETYDWDLLNDEIYEMFKEDDRYNPNAKYCIVPFPENNHKELFQILDKHSLEGISDAVCTVFNITFKELSSKSRIKYDGLYPKHFYYFYANKLLPKLSYNTISSHIGKFHHASVIHGIKKIDHLSTTRDLLVNKYIEKIDRKLKL